MSWIQCCNTSGGSGLQDLKTRILIVLSDIPVNQTININTASGFYSIQGDIVTLGANATEFNANYKLIVSRNDLRLLNGSNVIYISSNELRVPFILYKDESLIIQKFI